MFTKDEKMNYKTNKITKAIIETERLLNKELSYSEDLQKQDRVDFYRNHLDMLSNMLKEA